MSVESGGESEFLSRVNRFKKAVRDSVRSPSGDTVFSMYINRDILDRIRGIQRVRGVWMNRNMYALPFLDILDGSRVGRAREVVKDRLEGARAGIEDIRGRVSGSISKVGAWEDGWFSTQDVYEKMEFDLACKDGYTGKGVRVAVVDTGCQPRSRLLRGRSIVARDVRTGRASLSDDCGHGHWCVTCIGGGHVKLRDGHVVRGLTDCELISVKALYTPLGIGSDMSTLKGIIMACEDYGAKVVSMSLGSEAVSVEGLKGPVAQAIQYYSEKGVIFVVASGNSGEKGSGSVNSPGDLSHVLTVGSRSITDGRRSFYSSYGPTVDDRKKPDCVAFGGGRAEVDEEIKEYIVSGASGMMDLMTGDRLPNQIGQLMGTSMATPEVAAMVAVLAERNPDLRCEEVKDYLRGGHMGEKDRKEGWGAVKWSLFKE